MMCSKRSEFRTRDRLFEIERKASSIFSTSQNREEEKDMFPKKITELVIKSQLGLAELHLLRFEPRIPQGKDTGGIVSMPCFHPILAKYARDIFQCDKAKVLHLNNKCISLNESLWEDLKFCGYGAS